MKMLEARTESIEIKIDGLTTTGDSLSRSVRRGFAKMATKKDVEELRNMTARSFASVARNMATRDDLEEVRGYVEIRFDRFVGKVRKDYDGPARRTKDLGVANRKQNAV